MIYAQLMGGMGNQLFIYSFCKNLVKKTGQNAILYFDSEDGRKLEISSFNLDSGIRIEQAGFDNGYNIKRNTYTIFRKFIGHIPKGIVQDAVIRLSNRFGIVFVPEGFIELNFDALKKRDNIIVCGFFQSERYFSEIEEELSREFAINNTQGLSLSAEYERTLKKIEDSGSVCVHIRRGDYLDPKYKERFLVCDVEYYKQAIQYISSIEQTPKFYIFSDDIDGVKREYTFLNEYDAEFVDNMGQSVLYDFFLMTSCKHFIMSNSTLSWWVQYLSKSSKKTVVAPSMWLRTGYNNADIYQPNWHLINVK